MNINKCQPQRQEFKRIVDSRKRQSAQRERLGNGGVKEWE
jgi:hypothetical protein